MLLSDIAGGKEHVGFTLQVAVWLWFTVLFANFAEAMAEGRGKAQAESLRSSRTTTHAKRLDASDSGAAPNILEFEVVLAQLAAQGRPRRLHARAT